MPGKCSSGSYVYNGVKLYRDILQSILCTVADMYHLNRLVAENEELYSLGIKDWLTALFHLSIPAISPNVKYYYSNKPPRGGVDDAINILAQMVASMIQLLIHVLIQDGRKGHVSGTHFVNDYEEI